MNKKDYRIIQVTYLNGETVYRIQKKTRLFWIGPKIWETYSIYPNHYCDDYGWGWFLDFAPVNYTEVEDARKDLNEIIKQSETKIVKIQIVDNISCEQK